MEDVPSQGRSIFLRKVSEFSGNLWVLSRAQRAVVSVSSGSASALGGSLLAFGYIWYSRGLNGATSWAFDTRCALLLGGGWQAGYTA